MAKKRATPMEEPPAASSSDEEAASSEEEVDLAESSSGEEEETKPKKPSATPPPKPKNTVSLHTADSDTETESDSDAGSDSEPDHSKVKPIASKPMEDNTTETKKSQTKQSTAPKSATTSKRVSETDHEFKDSKRVKKEKDIPNGASTDKSGDDTKKQMFQRLWSEDDEIVLLKGMIDFAEKKGISPNADLDAFLEFIKKSLGFGATRSQLMEKIRRLKKKYENNAGKVKKNGEGRTFSKPHEQRAYELSKKIWGGEGTNGAGLESSVKSNGKATKKGQTGGNEAGGVRSSELPSSPRVKEEMKVVESAKEMNSTMLQRGNELAKIDNSMGLAGLEGFILNEGLGLVEESKRVEFEEKWKSIQLAEMELFVRRAETIAETAKLVLQAYKSAET